MNESQNIEFKEIWKDDYLKWVSGFANASGGKIYIGIDDTGNVSGLANAQKLLEDIPNKIVNYLGIIADLNLLESGGNQYIEIIVLPSSVPVSYKGVYHYRSGSTKQELKGNSLNQFLLKRMGRSWDDLPCENATINDIDPNTVAYFFQKASISKRIAENPETDDIETFLINLDLIEKDGKIKNAAILLFGKRPSRFFPSVTFKIGRFITGDDDLRFQDVIEGNILQMADKVMEILKSKYLLSPIHYKGLQRIEQLELPEEAFREAIFNAIIHKDYTGAPIQLSVYNDKLILWNEGRLPQDFTVETLLDKHPSRPFNRHVANVFFKAGFIEAWGRGIAKIINGFSRFGLPVPIFQAIMGGIMVTINRSSQAQELINERINERVNERINERINNLQKTDRAILLYITENPADTQKEIAGKLKLTEQYVRKIIKKLKDNNYITRIGSNKNGHWRVIDD